MVMRPLEPQELLDRCDLAGEAVVLDVVRNPVGHGMAAKLQFKTVYKGHVRRFQKEKRDIAIVAMRGSIISASGMPILGDWSDGYRPGTTVITHLDHDESSGLYRTSWWNAIRTLPTRPGQTNSDFMRSLMRILFGPDSRATKKEELS